MRHSVLPMPNDLDSLCIAREKGMEQGLEKGLEKCLEK